MAYDCIVLGVGGVGSAALLAAANRGWKVLGLEQYGTAHDRGSSHGRTRIIRTAYYEHPNYVPLARRAWDAWLDLESQCRDRRGRSVKLVHKTGLLQVGDPDGELIQGVLVSAAAHDIPIVQKPAEEWTQRFPAFQFSGDRIGVFEASAGCLLVENCVSQMIQLAISRGAEFRANSKVQNISIDSDQSITLRTDSDLLRTRRLIVTAGVWSGELLGSLPFEISILRKQVHWFQIDRPDIKYQAGFPAFLVESEDGDLRCFYGCPEMDYLGLKIAEHTGGRPVTDPQSLERDCDQSELEQATDFLDRTFCFSKRRLVHQSVCMYSMSADGHFIVDQHPAAPNLVFAAGLSGHGFKFAPVLGERLVGLLEGESDEKFDFLRMVKRSLV